MSQASRTEQADRASPEQLEGWRRMTPAERLLIADRHRSDCLRLLRAGILDREPALDEAGVRARLWRSCDVGDLVWLRAFIEPLNELGVDYMVTGSVASMLAGEPRMTLDVDIVVRLREEDIDRLIAAFPADRFYLPPRDVLVTEARRDNRGHFNVIETGEMTKADIYTVGGDELHHWALERTRVVEVDDLAIRVAPLEYVILRKLEFFREGGSSKHLRDIASALAISGERIDRSWLEREVARRGLQEQWRAAQP